MGYVHRGEEAKARIGPQCRSKSLSKSVEGWSRTVFRDSAKITGPIRVRRRRSRGGKGLVDAARKRKGEGKKRKNACENVPRP